MSQQDLHNAIIQGNREKILEILHVEGPVVLKTITNINDDSVLHLAFKNKDINQNELISILEIFINHGIDINVKNKEKKTILHLAIERRMRDVIDFRLRQNADINSADNYGNTIAHFAIGEECRKFNLFSKTGKLEMEDSVNSSFVSWMVSKGFDFFYTRNTKNLSAFDLAIKLNLQHIVLALLRHVNDFTSIERNQFPILYVILENCASSKSNCDPQIFGPVPSNRNAKLKFPFDFQNLKRIHPCYFKFLITPKIVKLILDKNEFMNSKTFAMAFRSAMDRGLPSQTVEILLERLNDVRLDEFSDSLIQSSMIKFGKFEFEFRPGYGHKLLQILIQKGANINQRERGTGETIALKLFCLQPCLEMLQLLNKCGADFRARTDHGDNFLHLICQRDNAVEMMDFLMTKSVRDLDVTNNSGETPLQLAIKSGNHIVANDLIKRGAKVHHVSNDGKTLISMACEKGQVRVVDKLIEYGADLEYRNKNGETLMHLAVESPDIIKLLVKSGVDINAKDNIGQTPIYRATEGAIKILFHAGARVDILDKNGESPLYSAVFRKNGKTTFELLKCGADILDDRVFQLAVNDFQQDVNSWYNHRLKRHLVKITALGLLNEYSYEPKGLQETFKVFFEKCQKEIERLKNNFIDDFTSLYKLLRLNRNRRCAYVDNEKLKNLVKDEKLVTQFPNYFDVISGCHNEARARKPVLTMVICIWEKVTTINFPDLCVDKIFSNFSNMDLLQFIEKFENTTINVIENV